MNIYAVLDETNADMVQFTKILLGYFYRNLSATSVSSAPKYIHLQGWSLKVARVINLKLIFYGLISLYFGNTNQGMQKLIPNLRRRSIISQKPGFFV